MENKEFDINPQKNNSDDKSAESANKRRISVFDGVDLPAEDDDSLFSADEDKIIRADGKLDDDQWCELPESPKKAPAKGGFIRSAFDIIEMFAAVTVSIILCFSFVFRLNVVEGPSMEETLHTGEYLVVSDILYDPTPGDIVVVHDITAGRSDPIVKRVVAVGGDTVDIDFDSWTLKVNGEIVDESAFRTLKGSYLLRSDYNFPIEVDEGCVFVMGDNRNNSSDSRSSEIGMIDERCVVGKVYARIFPFNKLAWFKNPYGN